MDGRAGDRRPGEVVASEQGRSVLWIGQIDVQEDTLKEDEDANREDYDADLETTISFIRRQETTERTYSRHNPVDLWRIISCPGEDE